MRKARSRTTLALVCIAVAINGCGGSQNPLHTDVHVPRILTGFWDGLTLIISMVFTLLNPTKYGIIAQHTGPMYVIGFIVGVCALIFLIFGVGGSYRRRRTTVVHRV